jgi:hypothetical protein
MAPATVGLIFIELAREYQLCSAFILNPALLLAVSRQIEELTGGTLE